MADKLTGRPCADVKNMYHSLVRSGKIKPTGSDHRPRSNGKRTESQRNHVRKNILPTQTTSDNVPQTTQKKKYRKSGIPLELAPSITSATPNTFKAARVLMSLDVAQSSSLSHPFNPTMSTKSKTNHNYN